MYKTTFIYLILAFVSIITIAQNHEIEQDFTWLSSIEIDNYEERPLQFKEYTGWNEASQLPHYSVQIPINTVFDVDSIDLSYTTKSSPISNKNETDYLFLHRKKDTPLLRKQVITINKENYLKITLTPIEYDSFSNQYNKINHVKINIHVPNTPIGSTLKSKQAIRTQSILANGKWVKIKILESGIHKIPYSLLTAWGFSTPSKVNVFGNGGNMLPKANNAPRLDDLSENAIMHFNDAIYFYAQGATSWTYNSERAMFVHRLHDYTDESFYFLSEDNGIGKRVELSTKTSPTFTNETDQFDSYQFHEFNNQNLLKSGCEWYGLRFDAGQERDYSFEFKNLVTNKPVKILTDIIGRSNTENYFFTYINNSTVENQKITVAPVDYKTYTKNFANEGSALSEFLSNSGLITVKMRYSATGSASSGWMNYICLNAKEKLILNDQLSFRNIETTGPGLSTRFNIKNATSNSRLWDVSNHTTPKSINIESFNSKKGFTYQTDELHEFVAFNTNASLPQPEFESSLSNQNLHDASVPDMLIISHPLFKDEAQRLAQIHSDHSGLECLIVEPEQIYNEFSSGSPDISGIRDFVRHLYLKNDRLKYLLLFGDGSYDNKTYDDKNTNFILTYQSENSLNISETYTSDDFFGCLDNNEGNDILNNGLDIGIGRLPVSSLEHAQTVVDKIDNYLNKREAGTWKTNITFVADDNQNNENNIHIRDADALSKMVYEQHPDFDHNKIYLDAYPKVITSTGGRYPEVNKAIKEQLENGTLIFNYTGHGNEKTLADEQILTIDAIQQLSNKNKLPIFVTATCEFSRYDEYHVITAGEWVLLSPNGGGVGLFTTTRIAWSSYNSEINKSFYRYIFNKSEAGDKLRLGDVIKATKNNTSNTVNKLNFTLLGDPAITLQYPNNTVLTTHVNGEENEALRKPLNAGKLAEVKGEVQPSNANSQTLHIKVFDKPIKVKTRGNGGYTPFEYELYANRIFEGTVDVSNNHFLTNFMVPSDVRLNVDRGRISYYAFDNEGNEAFGADNSVLIGGVSDEASEDKQGPDIKLWLNSSSFVDGDIAGSQPILMAQLEDESGINIGGIGIGHDISLVIDGDRSSPINLNSYYLSDKNTFKSGTLQYQLPQLETGKHTLEVKAWDNLNNSSTRSIQFRVHLDGTLEITNIHVYPNPIEPNETVKIYFEHDAPNLLLEITGSIYNISGRLIERFEITQPAIGTSITPIEWSPNALRKGVYIIHCEIRSSENQIGKFSKKILIIK